MGRTELYLNERPAETPPSGAATGAATGEAIEFHRRLPGYLPSPLVAAPSLAEKLGLKRVFVKDESSRLGLPSFKVLGAAFAVYKALDARAHGGLRPFDDLDELAAKVAHLGPPRLSAATDGNHGRAVAHMARLLGLASVVYVPAGTSLARIAAIEGEGAEVVVVDGSYDDAVKMSASDESSDCIVVCDTAWPGYEDVPGWIEEGYSTIFAEIEDELPGLPDALAVPIGVGALAAAAARHFVGRPGGGPILIGVEPLSADCMLASVRSRRAVTVPGPLDSIMAGLNCPTPSATAFPAVSAGFDAFVAIEDDPVRQAMRDLAAAGVVAGETGAASLAGVSELLNSDAASGLRRRLRLEGTSTLVLLSTEGATDPASYKEIVGAASPRTAGR